MRRRSRHVFLMTVVMTLPVIFPLVAHACMSDMPMQTMDGAHCADTPVQIPACCVISADVPTLPTGQVDLRIESVTAILAVAHSFLLSPALLSVRQDGPQRPQGQPPSYILTRVLLL